MTGSNAPQALDSVRETFEEFWRDRPVRPRTGGKFGGVSAALGIHYGIDPVLVRVAFVVGTFFGGSGLILYLLGWLVLPKEVGPGVDGPVTKHPSTTGLVLLLIPLAVLVWAIGFSSLFGLLLGLTALYLLQRRRAGGSGGGQDGGSAGGSATNAPQASGDDGSPAEPNTWVYPRPPEQEAELPVREHPPAWDPLGAAPFAWDLPEPTDPAPPEPPPPSRRWISFTVLGATVLAGLLTLAASGAPYQAAAVALGVLGVGMIVASFVRAGRKLALVAIPLAALAVVLSVLSDSGPWRGVTNRSITPVTIEAVQPNYDASVGNIELDLTEMTIPPVPVNGPTSTTVEVGMGNIHVRIPPELDVTTSCSADRGQVRCLAGERAGERVSTETTDFGTDGPGGGHITLDLRVDSGSVEVQRD
ncbi:PspC domain-containing protein [Parasphingorhabdus pacifica]